MINLIFNYKITFFIVSIIKFATYFAYDGKSSCLSYKDYPKDCYTVTYRRLVMSWLISMLSCRASYRRAVIPQAKAAVSNFLHRVFHYHSWITAVANAPRG